MNSAVLLAEQGINYTTTLPSTVLYFLNIVFQESQAVKTVVEKS